VERLAEISGRRCRPAPASKVFLTCSTILLSIETIRAASRIEVETRAQSEYVKYFRDNGPGFQILTDFEPFHNQAVGKELAGASIATIVNAHMGEILCRTTPARRVTFLDPVAGRVSPEASHSAEIDS